MRTIMLAIAIAGLAALGTAHSALAVSPEDFGLREGDVIRAEGDVDVFIVNEHGYKRLFVNEAIFGLYGHLGFDKVSVVTPAVRDAFITSGLFRNCESGDGRVMGLDVISDDVANLRLVESVNENTALLQRVFCINNAEQGLYGSGPAYATIEDVPDYGSGMTRTSSAPSTAVVSGHTPASVYASWARSVAQLLCFEFKGGEEIVDLWGGSGTLMRNRSGTIQLLTNNHVVPSDGFCLAEFWVEPSLSFFASNRTIVYAARYSEHLSTLREDDEAVMLLEPVSRELLDIFRNKGVTDTNVVFPDSLTEATRIAQRYVCGGADAEIGDEVAIIGYPSIGSTVGPTLTRGSISGRENSYYVTDAKIERGNSGGAAVLVKKNCYLGIPTSVVSGSLESLGRILDITRFQVFGLAEPDEDDVEKANIFETLLNFF